MKKLFMASLFFYFLFVQLQVTHAFFENNNSQITIENKGLFKNQGSSSKHLSFPVFDQLVAHTRPVYFSLKKTNQALVFGMKSMSRLATVQILPVYGNILRVSASSR